MDNKKTILGISGYDHSSTGTIAKSVLDYCESKGFEVFLVSFHTNNSYKKTINTSCGRLYDFLNKIKCRFDGSDGFRNKFSTRVLIKKIKKIKPSIIHLHNIHGRYINMEMLFNYCKKSKTPIIWTLHDCWAFTGKCPYFDLSGCQKWQSQCGGCPSKKEYPAAFFVDRTKHFLEKKIRIISNSKSIITLVTPSLWLSKLIQKSALKKMECVVINNGIPDSFKYNLERLNSVKRELKIENKLILFTAADGFSKRKGFDYILKLSRDLDPNKYVILVAGTDGKGINNDSGTIVFLGHLSSRKEMDLYYSVSDLFINPTLEDNFPTVNLESLANGKPVITFDTGGSLEMLDESTGIVIKKGDYKALLSAILSFKKGQFSQDNCLKRFGDFSKDKMNEKYFKLINNKIQKPQ